ncbi:hypothetical protein NQZ79_g7344 [Umbelopsis isabellina]|nr:hypothetical protein NQZ79_g7344 [Umbelopsis isabellina]
MSVGNHSHCQAHGGPWISLHQNSLKLPSSACSKGMCKPCGNIQAATYKSYGFFDHAGTTHWQMAHGFNCKMDNSPAVAQDDHLLQRTMSIFPLHTIAIARTKSRPYLQKNLLSTRHLALLKWKTK